MRIIQPSHKLVASKVQSWSQIKEEAFALKNFIKDIDNKTVGHYSSAFALSHAQVSDKPMDFFVINEDSKDLIKSFGSWCIVNLEIKNKSEAVYWKEGCMSFPFRSPRNVDRWNKIEVRYWVPFLFWLRPVTKKFEGLPAFICQHENDHSRAKNIHNL